MTGEVFKCGDYGFSTGLRIHKSKKHDAIEQLDGNDSDTEESYAQSYWEKDYISNTFRGNGKKSNQLIFPKMKNLVN